MTTTTQLFARPIVNNKYYIVEKDGKQIATIQLYDTGASFVHGDTRERFINVETLAAKYNIKYVTTPKARVNTQPTVNNSMWDVTRNLPLFTKSKKSKSYYCAGYYLINYDGNWVVELSPKLITLNRYQFKGPFATRELANSNLAAAYK